MFEGINPVGWIETFPGMTKASNFLGKKALSRQKRS